MFALLQRKLGLLAVMEMVMLVGMAMGGGGACAPVVAEEAEVANTSFDGSVVALPVSFVHSEYCMLLNSHGWSRAMFGTNLELARSSKLLRCMDCMISATLIS